jgi:hypothetical protein
MMSPEPPKKSMKSSFLFELTADNSFTMRFIDPRSGEKLECMHSLRGAFSETDYIYGQALRIALTKQLEPRILSVGLGLGYCEILTAALMLHENFTLESFESDPDLREHFRNWVLDQACAPDFRKVYEQTCKSAALLCGIEAPSIQQKLRQQLLNQKFVMHEELSVRTHFEKKSSIILFDAFSSKSSPNLWTEEFLIYFFKHACADQCVFSSYAATGGLKRALKTAKFRTEFSKGFGTKRESTFAFRSECTHS